MTSGRIEWNRQSWPATSMGAKEFERTQGRRSGWLGDVAEVWRRWCAEEEPGLAVTTSGTTGTPKRIQHSRKATACSVAQTAEALGLDEGCHGCWRCQRRLWLAKPWSFAPWSDAGA